MVKSACQCRSHRRHRFSSIPGSGRAPGKEKATHSNILAGLIPWTEEPDGLQSTGAAKELDMTEVMTEHAHTHTHRHTPEITWLLYSAFL